MSTVVKTKNMPGNLAAMVSDIGKRPHKAMCCAFGYDDYLEVMK